MGEEFAEPSIWEPPTETVKEPIKKLMENDKLSLDELYLGKERNTNRTEQETKAINNLKKNRISSLNQLIKAQKSSSLMKHNI